MLPRSDRLRLTKDIQLVLRQGHCFSTRYVRICTHLSSSDHTRIACVVGKSVHRSAVRRHRYQRQLRAIARRLLQEQPLARAYDMVWIAQPSLRDAPATAVLYEDIVAYWGKLKSATLT